MDSKTIQKNSNRLYETKPREEILDLFTFDNAKKFFAVPFAKVGNKVSVAIVDPDDLYTTDNIQVFLENYEIEFVQCDRESILEFIETHYNPIVDDYNKMIQEMSEFRPLDDKYRKIK